MAHSVCCKILKSENDAYGHLYDVLSPVSGIFWPSADEIYQNHTNSLGIVKRLNRNIVLVLPEDRFNHIKIRFVIQPGTWIQAYEKIAELYSEGLAYKEQTQSSDSAEEFIEVPAPSDGFLIFKDTRQQSYKTPGQLLHPGDLIATIELMKIRIDILFSGGDNSIFCDYRVESQRPVKRGEIIYTYKKGN